MKNIIAIYEYGGKDRVDLLPVLTTGKRIKLADIPYSIYVDAEGSEPK